MFLKLMIFKESIYFHICIFYICWHKIWTRPTTNMTMTMIERVWETINRPNIGFTWQKKMKKGMQDIQFLSYPHFVSTGCLFSHSTKCFLLFFWKTWLDEWWDNTIIWFMYWGGIFINIVTMEAAISIQGQEDTSLIPLTLFLANLGYKSLPSSYLIYV